MKLQRITLSDAARCDILEQADWYEGQAGHRLAKRWEKAVTSALLHVLQAPRSGQLCHFKLDQLSDIRRAFVVGFPKHMIFYRFRDKELFVLRVVHGARDLESLF